MPNPPPTYTEELTRLYAETKNIAARHGRAPEEVCDDLINKVCDDN